MDQPRPLPAPAPPAETGGAAPPRPRLRHDIQHELATVGLLATLLADAPDIGAAGRARARLLLNELRWLAELCRAYDEPAPAGRVRLDLIAAEVVAAMRLSGTRIELDAERLSAGADRLAFWRALRNLLQNAVRAAGPGGTVRVRIAAERGGAVVAVDDDGPGFAAPPGPGSCGLAIVRDLAAAWGGGVEIRRGGLGGASVRLRIPAARPVPPAEAGPDEKAMASPDGQTRCGC